MPKSLRRQAAEALIARWVAVGECGDTPYERRQVLPMALADAETVLEVVALQDKRISNER